LRRRHHLDAVPELLVILNDKRQIVFANQHFVDTLGHKDARSLLGVRFGEALKCIRASETEGGCGTAEACEHCGAVLATLASLRGTAAERECRLSPDEDGEARNLRVSTTPLELDGRQYAILCGTDISGDKRREALEHVLFGGIVSGARDMGQSADGLRGAGVAQLDRFREGASQFSRTLIEEINEHKILAAAEKGSLSPDPTPVETRHLLEQLSQFFENRPEARSRSMLIRPEAADIRLTTDPTLVRIVLAHMIKNALEACQANDVVLLNADARSNEVEFSVHNSQYIARKVQLQIFQRGFTTRGEGRGLGTYTMRMLSEKYLKGKVSFTSTKNVGTTFRACYPTHM